MPRHRRKCCSAVTARPRIAGGTLPSRVARRCILELDALVRRAHGVYEFTQDPDCILRLSLVRSRWSLELADAARIVPGDPVAIMHFWNERLPEMAPEGVDVRWAREMYRRLKPSFRLLAQYLAAEPGLAEVRAVCGEATFLATANLGTGVSLLSRLGLEIHPSSRGPGPWGRFTTFWQNAYSWVLIWAFNPASLRGRTPADLERYWLWMSREALERTYGSGKDNGSRDLERGVPGSGAGLGAGTGAEAGPAPGGPDAAGRG